MSDATEYLSGTADDQPTDAAALPVKRVALLLAQGYENAEAACVIDACGWTRYRPTTAIVEVHTVGLTLVSVSAFGECCEVDYLIGEIDHHDYDALVIPGGFHNRGFGELYDERVFELARAMHNDGKPIVTMCVGILPVAEAGLLAGGKATTYALSSRHDNLKRLQELGCETLPDEPVVSWNGIVSCSGPAHADEAVYLLLEELIGAQAASDIRRYRDGRASA